RVRGRLVACLLNVLEITHGQILFGDALEELVSLGVVGNGEEDLGVADRDLSAEEGRLDLLGELEQAQRVRHGGAAHAEVGRELLLRPAPSLEQQAVGVGKLDWIEIGAVKVLDDRDLEELLVGKIENASGNGGESDLARRAQTAFAENELVSAAALSNHERLKDAVAAKRGVEGRHVLGRELAARLIGVRIDEGRVDRMEREGAR